MDKNQQIINNKNNPNNEKKNYFFDGSFAAILRPKLGANEN